jgi:hypothetical protein
MQITAHLSDILGAHSYLDKDNILYKKIDNQWVGKPAIQVKPDGKGFQMKWEEDIKPTDEICK